MIEIITGLPGFGKTATAARWALKEMKRGKTVYANFPLKGAERFRDPLEVLGKVQNALIVVDEAGIVFDQLRMYEMPYETWMELRQHRKDGVDLLMTAQAMTDVAYPLRRLIQFEHNIFMKFGRLAIVDVRNPQPKGDRYGRRLWWLSKGVFEAYNTSYKVNQDQEDVQGGMDVVTFQRYRRIQDEMLMRLLEKPNDF